MLIGNASAYFLSLTYMFAANKVPCHRGKVLIGASMGTGALAKRKLTTMSSGRRTDDDMNVGSRTLCVCREAVDCRHREVSS